MSTYQLRAEEGSNRISVRLYFRWLDRIPAEGSAAAAAMTSAYRLQFRWHGHILPECGKNDDIRIPIPVQRT